MSRTSIRKELCFFQLYEKFIRDSKSGKRLQPNGKKLSPGTVANYGYTLKLVKTFSEVKTFRLRVRPLRYLNTRELEREKNYWKKFYRWFSDYLYDDCGCYDNYVGQCMKNIKVFFGYLNKELGIATGDFHKLLYVRKEEVPIFPLMPEELNYLIYDTGFERSLSPRLKEVKDFFVFGCTVGLRFSDLVVLKKSNLRTLNGQHYLSVRSVKTAVDTLIKLPDYAVVIVNRYRKVGPWLLPRFNKVNLNKYVKGLLVQAGFTHPVTLTRERRGKPMALRKQSSGAKGLRFCDVASTHTMRRTAITTMLSLGMTEQVVRKISGHAPNSKEFYRYTLWTQTYQDVETKTMFEKLKQRQLHVSSMEERVQMDQFR